MHKGVTSSPQTQVMHANIQTPHRKARQTPNLFKLTTAPYRREYTIKNDALPVLLGSTIVIKPSVFWVCWVYQRLQLSVCQQLIQVPGPIITTEAPEGQRWELQSCEEVELIGGVQSFIHLLHCCSNFHSRCLVFSIVQSLDIYFIYISWNATHCWPDWWCPEFLSKSETLHRYLCPRELQAKIHRNVKRLHLYFTTQTLLLSNVFWLYDFMQWFRRSVLSATVSECTLMAAWCFFFALACRSISW